MPRSNFPKLWSLITIVSSGLLTVAARAADDPPPVFDKRDYAVARKAAEKDGKWFLAKATAVWCGPCKQMNKTTFRDEKVVKWLKEHAIIVEFDVDKDKKLAKDLKIAAMPTLIAFKNGKTEFDRVVGYRAPADFLAWLEGIDRGETSIVAIKQRAGTRNPADGKVDIRARLDLARSLDRAGKLDEAADEYVWLWRNMLKHDQGYYGVRLSFMAGDMERLAARSAVAKKKFTELRDEVTPAIQGAKVDRDDLVDWVTLNKIVGDTDATLAWFEKVKDEPRRRPLLKYVDDDLEELLISKGRWADVGRVYPDPIEALKRQYEFSKTLSADNLPSGISAEQRKYLEDMPKQKLRDKAGILYAGTLAAGREDVAQKLAARARELDESPAMIAALVSTAFKADQPRKQHLEWIEAADKQDESLAGLREKVQAALSKTSP